MTLVISGYLRPGERHEEVGECAALAALLFLWGDLIVSWNAIPDRIPGHYDFAENVTRASNPGSF